MAGVNLLPQELKPTGYILKVSKIMRRIVIIGLVVFFVFFAAYGALVYGIGSRTKVIKASQTSLESKIKTLQDTEQRLVLIKDRLTKISQVSMYQNISKEIKLLEEINSSIPSGVEISKVDILPGTIKLSLTAADSNLIKNAILTLNNPDQFVTFEIIALRYKGSSGYEMEINVD